MHSILDGKFYVDRYCTDIKRDNFATILSLTLGAQFPFGRKRKTLRVIFDKIADETPTF